MDGKPARSRIDSARMRRLWLARLGLLLLSPVLAVGGIELGLWTVEFGWKPSYFIRSLDGQLLSNPHFGWRFYGSLLSRPPIPAAIAEAGHPESYRVVILGGSAAEGVPDSAFSFGRLLEAMLGQAISAERFEIINAGMTAANSHVVRAVAADSMVAEPDCFIVYLGHNEVTGPHGAAGVIGSWSPSLPVVRASLFVRGTRVGQLISRLLPVRPGGPTEWRGMEMFVTHTVAAQDPKLAAVYRNLEANLRAVISTARAGGARVILCTPLTNLRDCPPFASRGRADLSEAARTAAARSVLEGDELAAAGSLIEAVRCYRNAAAHDPDDAGVRYRLGRAMAALGRWSEARQTLEAARDLDTLRFRADTAILDVIRSVAASESKAGDVELVDLDQMVAQLPGAVSIPGSDLLYEHVHLTFAGNHLVAAAVLPAVIRAAQSGLPLQSDRPSSEPTSLERTLELVHFTDRHRLAALQGMARLTSHAPFSAEWRGRYDIEILRLRQSLSPDDLDREISWLRDTLISRPNDLLLRHRLASSLAARGEQQEAIEEYHRLLGRYPHASSWREELATLLVDVGLFDEAIDHYRSALAIRPGDVSLRVGLGEALRLEGRDDEALVAYRSALALRAEQGTAHLGAGVIQLRRGEVGDAESHFRSAAEHLPTSPLPHAHLAEALARQGRHVEAEAEMRRALELDEALGADRSPYQVRAEAGDAQSRD